MIAELRRVGSSNLPDVSSAPAAGGTPCGGRWHPRRARGSTAATGGGRYTAVVALLVLTCYAPASETDAKDAEPPDRHAAILPIHDMIRGVMVESLQRRVDAARAQGAGVIIFELDTPGGLVSSAIQIADLIKGLDDVTTIAWVNTNAHSGGAMVAVACDEIVMARSARIGDSQVIMGGPGGVTAVPEELQPKANTPVLAEFRASATLNGYSQVLSEAFVLPDREVWWLEHVETGEREFVFRDKKMRRLGEQRSTIFDQTSEKATPAEPEWKLVDTYYNILLDKEVPTNQPIVPDTQLLEMSPAEAYAYGFSKGIASSEEDLLARYSLDSIVRLNPTWSESLAYWMTSMYVRGFLMVIILLAAYVEFHTPGVGVPGLVALICLAIFVGAPYMTGLANVWEILLIVVGVLLLTLEAFVIPGFGIAGISGIMLLITGIVFTFAPDEPGRSFPLFVPSFRETVDGLKDGLVILSSALVVSIAGMLMLRQYLPRMPVLRGIIPDNPTPSQVQVEDPYRGAARVGDLGEAAGPLRPAGKARFGSILVDVVTQGEYLEERSLLEVVERRGNRVVVRALSQRGT